MDRSAELITEQNQLDPGRVVMGRGRMSLLSEVISSVLNPGDHVAIVEPVVSSITEAILEAGARYVNVGRTSVWEAQRGALVRARDSCSDSPDSTPRRA